MLRAVVRKRSEHKSKSRSRSPGNVGSMRHDGDQSGTDHIVDDHDGMSESLNADVLQSMCAALEQACSPALRTCSACSTKHVMYHGSKSLPRSISKHAEKMASNDTGMQDISLVH